MGLLVFVTVLWAVSFSLIGEFLSGQVDSDFAVLTRVLLAALIFLPFTVWRGVPRPLLMGIMLCGALQFGITYALMYRSFAFLTVPEVLLFTIFTPLYVTLIDDALNRRFSPGSLLAAAIATLGAAVMRYDGLSQDYLLGFFMLQIANITFAAGQVGYKHLMHHWPTTIPPWRTFGHFFIGALMIALPSFLVFGNTALLPSSTLHWGILVWLGVVASGAGLYLWNRGACEVDAGTLAVMNNALVPAGLVVNLAIWGHDEALLPIIAGGSIIALSLWVNARLRHAAMLTPRSLRDVADQ